MTRLEKKLAGQHVLKQTGVSFKSRFFKNERTVLVKENTIDFIEITGLNGTS